MQFLPLRVATGDLITQQDEDGRWSVIKILCVDQWPDGSAAAHCRTYMPVDRRPTTSDLATLRVRVGHAPIAAGSFARGWKRIGNQPVVPEDIDGFLVYLKLTDFPRYLKVSGEDAGRIISAANEHYRHACALGDEGRRQEAIAEYDRAIDLFPMFYEAIDNRAFTFMELGDYRTALAGFQDSLRMHPDGMAAFFSRGECLLRLKQYAEAEAVFAAGLERFPEHREQFAKFLALARSARA